MKLKNKTKFLLVFGIIFVAFLLFNTNNVNAAETSNYKCKIEKDGYILYNNYFNTSDIKDFSAEYDESHQSNIISFSKYDVNSSIFNNMTSDIKNKKSDKLLVEIKKDVTSAKLKDTSENLEIIELNNKKYAVVNVTYDLMFESLANIGTWSDTYKIEMISNNGTESKNVIVTFNCYSTDYFRCDIKVVDKNGKIYATAINTNADIAYGGGLESLPKNIDLSSSYVEYFANQYVGENIKINCLGNVPYVGKYGEYYKYKANLKNAKFNNDGVLCLDSFSYKNSEGFGGFFLDDDYTIDNETYVENKETSTDTKLKFDLQGKFKGTLKAEEVSKSDLVYGKIEEKLNKNSADDLYMWIGNIYIENGSFEGNLKLTFNVGEQYNGKNYFVTHMKNENYEFEEFKGIVKDGKIEITVDSLSPFGITITENTDNTITNQEENKDTTKLTETKKGEKDETPKTGIVNIMGYVLLASVLSGLGIVTLKKKIK